MATNDKEPRSVMSRGKGNGQVIHGARMVKHRRWTSPQRGTWPVKPDERHDSDRDPSPPTKRQKTKRVLKDTKEKARHPFSPKEWTTNPVEAESDGNASSASSHIAARNALIT